MEKGWSSMKTKNQLFCMILCGVLLLCGCGIRQFTPSIAQTEFSKENQNIIQTLSNDTKFLDFTIDSSVTTATVTIRYHQDGTWQEPEEILALSDMQPGNYHLILRWIEDRIDAYISSDSASYSNTYILTPEWVKAFDASVTQSEVGFGSKRPIVAGEEIPLWCIYGSNTEEISSQSSDYQASDCDIGLVFAVTFS